MKASATQGRCAIDIELSQLPPNSPRFYMLDALHATQLTLTEGKLK